MYSEVLYLKFKMSGNSSNSSSYRFCPHCMEKLAPRTHREHLRLFYDANSHTWTKKMRLDQGLEVNMELPPANTDQASFKDDNL